MPLFAFLGPFDLNDFLSKSTNKTNNLVSTTFEFSANINLQLTRQVSNSSSSTKQR